MAIVRYCILDSSTNVCTDVINWDNTYTYYPGTGRIIAGDNTGEVGWSYSSGASAGGSWTIPPYGSAPTITYGPLEVADGGTGASTLTGIVKGNGTSAFTAAVAGTDYVAPSSYATGIATFLGAPSSANLLAAMTTETGTGTLVFNTSPSFATSVGITGGTATVPATLLDTTQTWNMPTIATTGASGSAGTATLTFSAQATAIPVGSTIVVAGVTPTGYNGTYTVTASTTTSVSYANATTGAQTVAGTVQPLPTAIKLNVTDTASNASSLLMDLQIGGASKAKIDKNGYVTAPRHYWNSTSYSSIGASNLITFTETNGTSPLGVGAHSVNMGAITALSWWNNNIVGNGSTDTFITRRNAANLRLGAADTTGSTAPTAQTLSVQSWSTSTTNNQAGANFTITGSQGTGSGAGGNIIFQLAPGGVSGNTANALTNVMTLWPTGQTVIGANNPAAALYNTTADSLIGTSATGSSQLRLISSSATTSEGGWLVFTRTAGGSLTSPTATASGATIGNILFQGYDGTSRQSGAQISAVTGGLYSGTSSPAYLAFSTTASGSTTLTERVRIGPSGEIGLGGANYGTSGQVLTSNGSGAAPTWQTSSGGSSLPSGMLAPYAGSSAPSGWLLCDGSAVSRTTYSALFTAISTTYGAGDGSTTFNLPDLRGRAVRGLDNMGGTAANRITSGGSGITGTTLGASGGAETVTLTTAQMPAHTHNVSASSSTTGAQNTLGINNQSSSTPGGTSIANAAASNGSGSAHNNTGPTIMLNYIIKT